MKKSINSLLVACVISMSSVCVLSVNADVTPPAAPAVAKGTVKVSSVVGSVKVILPGSKDPVEVKSGDILPAGTTFVTSDGGEISLEFSSGLVSTFKGSSGVTKFSLSAENGQVAVKVSEGAVTLTDKDGQPVTVNTGNSATITSETDGQNTAVASNQTTTSDASTSTGTGNVTVTSVDTTVVSPSSP